MLLLGTRSWSSSEEVFRCGKKCWTKVLDAGVKKPQAPVCVICGWEKQGVGSDDSDDMWEGCGLGSIECRDG